MGGTRGPGAARRVLLTRALPCVGTLQASPEANTESPVPVVLGSVGRHARARLSRPAGITTMTDEEDARRTYREAWERWRSSEDEGELRRLEKVMDGCQPRIAVGPWDPRWQEFASSLPGYLEFWPSFKKWGERKVEEMERRERGEDVPLPRPH